MIKPIISLLFLISTSLFAANTSPVVSGFNNQIILEGGWFSTISLDNYVTDAETSDQYITWTYSGNTDLIVSITNRIATVTTPNSDWSGSETITFTATDDDPTNPLSASGDITFTVVNDNDPPVITGQNTITIDEDNNYEVLVSDLTYYDVDNPVEDISVIVNDDINYSVSSGNIITPDNNFYGNLTVSVQLNDGEDNSNIYYVTVTVLSINDAPNIWGQATIYVDQNVSFPINVADLSIYDPDNTSDQMSITVLDGDNYSVTDGNVITPDLDYHGAITIPVYVDDGQDTSNTYGVTAEIFLYNNPPTVDEIPDQTIYVGTSFATVSLNDFVNDIETADNDIVWTYSGNSELAVSIVNNIATITPPTSEWIGYENITFTATDNDPNNPKSASDDVWYWINDYNTPPVLSKIPDQTVDEGFSFAPINLDNFVSDLQTADENITWIAYSLTSVFVDIENRVATVYNPDENWYGSDTIIFMATDDDPSNPLSEKDTVIFTVISVNDAPFIAEIPDQTIFKGESFEPIDLDQYVTDDETPIDSINWDITGNTNLDITVDDNVVTLTPNNSFWLGFENITFTATDNNPTPLSSSTVVSFKIIPPSSLNERNLDQGISVYPNPTNGFVSIKIDNSLETISSIEIYNIEGRKVKTYIDFQNIENLVLDLSVLKNGLYLVKIITNKGTRILNICKY